MEGLREIRCKHPGCNKILFECNLEFIKRLLQKNKESGIMERQMCRSCKKFTQIYVDKDKIYATRSI